MNEYLSGFILGLIQGLTEFLPVSSSGHLALLEAVGIGESNLFFNLALHLATLLAVVAVYRKRIWELIRHPLSPDARFILTASVPTAVIAALIRFLVPDTVSFLPFFFTVTAVLLLLPNLIKTPSFLIKKPTLQAIFVGTMQGLACFNGISRSGATTSTLLMSGFDADKSAELSFLLSIPIIVGSSAVECLAGGLTDVSIGGLAIGAVTAFVVGLIAIKGFINLLKKRKLWIFSVYTFLMAILSFLLLR